MVQLCDLPGTGMLFLCSLCTPYASTGHTDHSISRVFPLGYTAHTDRCLWCVTALGCSERCLDLYLSFLRRISFFELEQVLVKMLDWVYVDVFPVLVDVVELWAVLVQ